MEEMSECSTGLHGEAPKAFTADSAKTAFDHIIKTLTLEDLRLMGRSWKSWMARLERDSGESSATGISSRNRGCLGFLSLVVRRRLLRGLERVAERQVLACWMAASLEVGGVGEEDKEEQSGDRGVILGLWWRVEGKEM